jgi:hypothetical protein
MVRLSFPDLYQVLQETTVINMIGISWFLTLFISAFRLPNCVRIPDCFFFDGPRGMFSAEQAGHVTFRPGYPSQQSCHCHAQCIYIQAAMRVLSSPQQNVSVVTLLSFPLCCHVPDARDGSAVLFPVGLTILKMPVMNGSAVLFQVGLTILKFNHDELIELSDGV